MSDADPGVLVLGYGNPGRLDDGLGPAFADAVARLGIEGVAADADYQLQPEDALRVARSGVVVFADADTAGPGPFRFLPVVPRRDASFTTHALSPQAVVALARDTFGARPEAYLLGIRGHEFDEFGETLSERARENLAAALRFLEPLLRSRRFREAAEAGSAVEGGDDD